MLFFPYKVDLDLKKIPFLTLLICAVCITVYYFQVKSNNIVISKAQVFCANASKGSLGFIVQKVTGSTSIDACIHLISTIHSSARPDKMILQLAEQADKLHSLKRSDSVDFMVKSLQDLYSNFQSTTPQSLTAQLMYDPRSYRLDRMVSASFSHGSWTHLVGNLFFFFAFAATVEILVGGVAFFVLVIFLAVATNVTYALVMFNDVLALPTLGLSGVVMGMIGLFTFLLPKAKIRCFLWFILLVRILRIPAWILAAWYIGWDVFNLYFDSGQSNVNIIAHVSGAVFGLLAGLILFRKSRSVAKQRKNLNRIA